MLHFTTITPILIDLPILPLLDPDSAVTIKIFTTANQNPLFMVDTFAGICRSLASNQPYINKYPNISTNLFYFNN